MPPPSFKKEEKPSLPITKPEKNLPKKENTTTVQKPPAQGSVPSLSLKGLKMRQAAQQKQKEIQVLQQDTFLEEDFTQEEFLHAWQDYIKSLYQKGSKILLGYFTEIPELDGKTIRIKLKTETAKQEVLKDSSVLEYLQNALRNHSLSLDLVVVESPQEQKQDKFLIHFKDKYDNMLAENPLLEQLRIKLDLDY